MVSRIITGLIGKRIGERYGNNGLRGAVIGAVAPALLRRALGPAGLAIGGAYLAKKAYDGRKRRNRAAV